MFCAGPRGVNLLGRFACGGRGADGGGGEYPFVGAGGRCGTERGRGDDGGDGAGGGGGSAGAGTATSVTIGALGGSTTGSPMNVPLVALSLIALSSAVTAD